MKEIGNMIDRAISFGTGILGKWKLYAAIAGALVMTHGLAYCEGRKDGKHVERASYAEQEREASKVQNESAGVAAGERETDRTNIGQSQKERDDAITSNAAPDQRPSASRIALNCERMRQSGADISDIPACRGREAGTETNPRP